MVVWHRGAAAVAALASEKLTHVQEFLEQLTANKIPRVPGSAVFLTRTTRDIPPVMAWHVKHNRSLHHSLLVLSVVTQSVPWIAENERLQVTKLAPDFWRATARFGFMEHPDIPALLVQTRAFGCNLELRDVTYYVGHETIVRRTDGKGLAWWEEALYAAMVRNAAHVSEILRLPADAVVEIGRQAAI
jgi:KUP system potassium uptake protein